MVTKEQALTSDIFHYTGNGKCRETVGSRGGVTQYIMTVRRSGKTKAWKRSPDKFRIPVKYGLYEGSEITEANAELYHTQECCPLNKVK